MPNNRDGAKEDTTAPLEHCKVSLEKTHTDTSHTPSRPVSDDDVNNTPAAGVTSGSTDQPEQPSVLFRLPRWKKRALFACSCLLQFLLQFDVAAVAVTIPVSRRGRSRRRIIKSWLTHYISLVPQKIAEDQETTQVKAFALATGYYLAQTIFQLVFSHVSHALGRTPMYLLGLLFYMLGAAIAGCNIPMDVLIAARVIQGIGAAGMFSMSAIVIVEMTQPRQRAAWTSLTMAGGAFGNICGPLVAGAMFKRGFPWRSVFHIEIGLAAFLFGPLARLLPWDIIPWRRKNLKQLKDCDWIGMGLFMICAVGILVPINIAGTASSLEWTSKPVLISLLFGVVILLALVYHQRCLAKRPAFPREVFARRPTAGISLPFKWFASVATSLALIGSTVCSILLFAVFYSLILFWEAVRQKSTVGVGLVLLSVTVSYPVAFALTGMAIKKWGRIRWAIVVGTIMTTLGLGLMQLMSEGTHECCMILISIVAGAGCGVFAPAMVNAVLSTTDPRWHPHAIAIRTLLYTAGQCIGVSLCISIFTTYFKRRFEAFDPVAAAKAGIPHGGLGSPQSLVSKISQLQELAHGGELIKIMVSSLRCVWGAACALAGLTGTLTILMNCPDLAQDNTTRAVPSDKEQQQDGVEMVSR
jgi:MFS family permease